MRRRLWRLGVLRAAINPRPWRSGVGDREVAIERDAIPLRCAEAAEVALGATVA